MSKYSRYQSVVSRQSDENISEDHWLKQFQKTLQKDAVQPKKIDSSLFDQINSIMNGKSKYPSVSAAVEEMKERSGLTAYLDKISKLSQEDSGKRKTAADENNIIDKDIPVVIQKCPKIKDTLQNCIDKGNSPVPAVLDRLRSIHQGDVSDAKDWEDVNLIKLISKLNLMAKRDNPDNYQNFSNLGKRDTDPESDADPSNHDAFHALTPVKD